LVPFAWPVTQFAPDEAGFSVEQDLGIKPSTLTYRIKVFGIRKDE
jgi:hypothetical protein